jgi:hypothetical protein
MNARRLIWDQPPGVAVLKFARSNPAECDMMSEIGQTRVLG